MAHHSKPTVHTYYYNTLVGFTRQTTTLEMTQPSLCVTDSQSNPL